MHAVVAFMAFPENCLESQISRGTLSVLLLHDVLSVVLPSRSARISHFWSLTVLCCVLRWNP